MQDKNTVKNKYLSDLPYLIPQRGQKFFGIVLTLCVLSFFGFFAIKPTVSTILTLQKEISDSQFVLEQLETKINNLTELREQYSALQSDLPIVESAISVQPDVQVLFAQIQSIAQTSNITIKKIQNSEVAILKNGKNTDKNYSSYSFSIAGAGSFENISKFAQTLTDMERIVNIDTFSINSEINENTKSPEFDITGVAYFKDL